MEIKLLIFFKDRWEVWGTWTQTILHECGPMSYRSPGKLAAPQKGFHIVMLQNLPVTDLTFMIEDHDVRVKG